MNENENIAPTPQPEAPAVETPAVETPVVETPTKKPTNKKLAIGIGIGVVVLIIAIVATVLIIKNQSKPAPTPETPTPQSKSISLENCADRTKKASELTKETAYDFALKQSTEDQNCIANFLLDGSEDFYLTNKNDQFIQLYSYEKESEIQDIANNSYYINRDAAKKEWHDFTVIQRDGYAVVYDESRRNDNISSYVGITFDKKILDYFDFNSKIQKYSSDNEYTFAKTSDINQLKRIFDIISMTNYNRKRIYNTEISFDGTNYIYQVYYIGVSHDTNYSTPNSYILALYRETTLIDSKTGFVQKIETSEDGETTEKINSFPLTKKEAMELL